MTVSPIPSLNEKQVLYLRVVVLMSDFCLVSRLKIMLTSISSSPILRNRRDKQPRVSTQMFDFILLMNIRGTFFLTHKASIESLGKC